jgi:predicted nucleotidyltransferase component of viral defense system
MKSKEPSNIAASVKARLMNIARENGINYQYILRQYVQERFLYRLSQSIHKNSFILKGALLFLAHDISNLRPTRDIDFLGVSISNKIETIEQVVKDILKVKYNDGVSFVEESVEANNIVEDGDYQGIRVKLFAYLESTRIRTQLDVGFGDQIVEGPVNIDFPVLLDFECPKLKAYSVESAIAEKFEAIVSISRTTSRMKDFYDIIFFAEFYQFRKNSLKEAIVTTFTNRGTNLKSKDYVMRDEFKDDKAKQDMWFAFLERTGLESKDKFSDIISKLKTFVEPVFVNDKEKTWNPKKWKWE